MMLVIDTSTSIDNTELGLMRSAFVSFVNAFLPGTPSQIAVVSFDDSAVLRSGFTNNVATLTTAINGTNGDGYTNWEDALADSRALFPNRSDKPDLIVFSSDGNPTASSAGPNNTSQPNAHLAPAITQANLAKAAGIRIILLGIGNELSTANLVAISSADAVYTSNFSTLAADLATLATDLCGGHITVIKKIGTPDSWTPAGTN